MSDTSFFQRRGIVVKGVPVNIRKKAMRIIRRIEGGTPYWRLGGKRLQVDRNVVSLPVTYRWRIIARFEDGSIVPERILSHEAYNGYRKHKRL